MGTSAPSLERRECRVTLANLVDYSRAHNARFVLVRPDTQLLATLKTYGTLGNIGEGNVFPPLPEAFSAF